jgi:DsbC/DsbD-like thiol-disulfide interchange protein/cytochrome c biogenesis protein CcdA
MTRQGLSFPLLRSILMTLLAFVGFAAPLRAENNISARLVAETAYPAPGQPILLAIDMQPKPGWHGYWKNPGDAGVGIALDWTLPKGATLGPMRWPVPERLVVAGLMNHVFNGDHALLLPLTLPRGIAPGTVLPLRAEAQWLACTDKICVPERGTLSLDLTIGDGRITPDDRARFDAWRAKLSIPLGSPAIFQREGDRLRISLPFPANAPLGDAWFYAATEDALAYAAPQTIVREGDRLVIETQAKGETPKLIEGVISNGPSRGFDIVARPGIVAPARGGGTGFVTVLMALGGAILGGLMLNIMPCVFPVISLKAMSLARAGGDERAAKAEALAYTAGVILTCLALGGLLLALRAGGLAIGWAFQLQEPRVILLLLLLVTAIALNLAHVFHLRGFGGGEALAGKDGVAGSFWTGVLAAFVATPCTGPFMAAALGAALVLPVAAAMAIFAGLGLGLALPFLLIGFVPALRRLMPRPGPWMARFQAVLSVPMFLTALALGWLLWRQTGAAGLAIGIGGALVLAIGLFWLGRLQAAGKSSAMLGLALLAGSGALAAFAAPATQAAPARSEGEGVPFSEAKLANLRKAGQPVFLYFTADWCLTCKVNEQTAINREEVQRAFAKNGVTVMVGDWTNADPAIGRFLEAQGRSGVPLYLFYPKGGGAARELPQVLTPAMLTALTR